LETEVNGLRKERERLLTIQVDVSSELVARKESEAALAEQVAELTEQTQRLANFDGKVWEKAPFGPAPAFRPLRERGVPIIALTNLKGGVGKTTLAANLGALLAQDKRVLLVDLDYQGSLTSLCLPPQQIEEIRRRAEFGDRILQSPSVDLDEFQRCCHAVPDRPGLRLIAADESLADVENRAMAEWLLHPECGDVRHVLRSYLHAPEVWQDYDYVFLDCPPRLTTACINAFAAADFVLIPVIPDQTSAEAVPRQLRALKNLQAVLCPRLDVLGLVANRTSPRDQLVQREQAIWDSLPRRCEDPWGREIYQFRSLIRQKGSFAEAARANRFAVYYQDVEPMFRDLARELIQRIAAHERQRPATVFAEPQPAA
jgi:cellulose biosynthesis protein BcsQ